MVTPIQKKWFRIEQDASGAILSCEEVEAKGRKGAHVRYYEAVDKAEACAAAKAWHARKLESARRTNSRPERRLAKADRRKSLLAAGKCYTCERQDAQTPGGRCRECQDRCNLQQRERRAGAPTTKSPRRVRPIADQFSNYQRLQAEARDRVKKVWGSQRGRDYALILKRYDGLGPRDFRAWLTAKVVEHGGAKALAEYEASRAETLDKATTAAYKRAAKATRRAE